MNQFHQTRARRVKDWGFDEGERFARGIFPSPELVFPVPTDPQDVILWHNRPEAGLLTGTLFLDGSALWASAPFLARAGWSIVQVDRFGQ